jgi:TATA-binding protein-associated factor Taf7
MIDFDSWAEELGNSKMDLVELLQTHMELVQENEKRKQSMSTNEVESIKQAVDHLLECDLTEENGWTEEEINKLEKVSSNDFELRWK